MSSGEYKAIETEDFPFPHVLARYATKGRDYKGNHLIEALPRFPSTRAALQKKLNVLPKFSRSCLNKGFLERRFALRKLTRFFITTARVCELAEFVYSELLQGYAARAPNSAEANRIMQNLYLKDQAEKATPLGGTAVQFCSALTGIPGAGKSIAVAQVSRLFPPIIYHPDLNIWQIPLLLIQMPYHGKRGVSLGAAIIGAIHERYPIGDYRALYLEAHRNDDLLMADAMHLLGVHRVGLLIVDDAQHTGPEPLENYNGEVLERAIRPRTPMAWAAGLLFQASNTMHVPLLFVATAELEGVLCGTMSKLRRAYGNGLAHWDPLDAEIVPGRPSEYDIYINVLWSHTLLRKHPPFDASFRNVFHFYTFGVPDFIVKLYYIVQWRMLQENRETFTLDDVHFIANRYLKPIVRITGKMRRLAVQDPDAQKALSRMPDMAAEFKLRDGVAGVMQDADANQKSLEEEAAKPPSKPSRNGRKRPAASDRAPLVQAQVADASQIGCGK